MGSSCCEQCINALTIAIVGRKIEASARSSLATVEKVRANCTRHCNKSVTTVIADIAFADKNLFHFN